MRWLPWRGGGAEDPAAREAAAEAEKRLREAHGRWPEVRRRADWARARERENHLTELFHDLRGGTL